MRVSKSCAKCLYDKQAHLSQDEVYLEEVRNIINNRKEKDTAPYLVYRFNQAYEKIYGKGISYKEIKKKYNDLVLSMETVLRKEIQASNDPIQTAFLFARLGNYIDFGAMNEIDDQKFLALFQEAEMSKKDKEVMTSFLEQCKKAKTFLLITDNCGEIVLDKLFLEELKKCFPQLKITVLVRGGEILNDATREDAEYVGLDKIAVIEDSANKVAGTIYDMLPKRIQDLMDHSDVILSKGQGNFESLSYQGRHIFYSFLCKCDLFIERFDVPVLSGMFVEENKPC